MGVRGVVDIVDTLHGQQRILPVHAAPDAEENDSAALVNWNCNNTSKRERNIAAHDGRDINL